MKITNQPTGHHYITEIGTILNTKKGGGKRDSLLKTAIGMIIYDENRGALQIGVIMYYEHGACYRYFDSDELNSRDHAVISNACWKMTFGKPLYTKVQKTSPRFTPGQRIWLKAMVSKPWSIVYLIYKLPGLAMFYPLWNWILRAISGTLRTYENPADLYYRLRYFDKIEDFKLTVKRPSRWKKFCHKLTLKAFVSFYTLVQINALESQWVKRILQKVMILHFEQSNHVARAMCGQKVPYPKGYMPSRNMRPLVRLDRTCDRDMKPYPDTKEDNLEMAMLKYYCYEN